MTDDLLCAALARSIAVRLPLWSEDELRALDLVALTIESIRHGDGRDWLRRMATGPGDLAATAARRDQVDLAEAG